MLTILVIAYSVPFSAANTADNVQVVTLKLDGSVDLDDASNYSGGLPTLSSDVTFQAAPYTYSTTTFSTVSGLTMGTLNDLSSTALSVGGGGLITLKGGSNSVSGTATDLMYVAPGGSLTITDAVALGATGTINIVGNASISGVLSGGAFTKTGSGTLTLSNGSNSRSGTLTIREGAVSISHVNDVGAGNSPVTIDGGTLQVTANLGGGSNWYHIVTIGANGGTIRFAGSNTQISTGYSNQLTGSGALTVAGNGTLTSYDTTGTAVNNLFVLKTTNNYAGAMTLKTGAILQVSGSGSLGTSTLTLENESEVYFSATSAISNSITVNGTTNSVISFSGSQTLNGDITNNGTLSFHNRSFWQGSTPTSNATTNNVIAGVISGSGGVIVGGPHAAAGQVIFTGANTYTGTTSVVGGVLQVGSAGTGSVLSAVTVNGGTLAGTGVIGNGTNTATITTGTLAPGDNSGANFGTLSFDGNLSVASGGKVNLKLGGADAVDSNLVTYLANNPSGNTATYLASLGTLPAYAQGNVTTSALNDFINVTGNLSMSGSTVTFTGSTLTTADEAAGDVFRLLDWDTLGTSFGSATLDMATLPALGSNLGWDTSAFSTYGIITIVTVPEPSRALFVALGLACLLTRRMPRR